MDKSLPALALIGMLSSAPTLRAAQAGSWDTFSDTWVATDALGRPLPAHADVGGPRSGRFVGIFYFLWLGQHGTGGPYDISKILAAVPDDPPWGPVHAFHHWHESQFGYYLSDDPFVLRKHAQMLADAGIDTLIFDTTNGFPYIDNVRALGEVFREVRRQGGSTPQFCFLAHPGAADQLYDAIYAPGQYEELWFRWQGKPLLLAHGERPDPKPEVLAFFTVKRSWAWSTISWFGNGQNKWPWLDHYPQGVGWSESPALPEEISVTVAQHPTTNIGRSYSRGSQPPPEARDPGRGICFAEQWQRALSVDPAFVFVTGWNEWVAQRFLSDGTQWFLGRRLPAGGTYFIDTYDQEYSRDIEPMRGGHSDNYYYQLAAYVRRYKGVRPPALARSESNVVIDGRFDDWESVTPEFRDTIGDPVRRDYPGWGAAGRYVDTTGRNDLKRCKVSYDEGQVAFYAECAGPLSPPDDAFWMHLYLDTDQDAATGWLGYDLSVAGVRAGATDSLLMRRWGEDGWADAGSAPFAVEDARLELALPYSVVESATAEAPTFDFKWADNCGEDGAPAFTLHGDAAPNDRFSYRFEVTPPAANMEVR